MFPTSYGIRPSLGFEILDNPKLLLSNALRQHQMTLVFGFVCSLMGSLSRANAF